MNNEHTSMLTAAECAARTGLTPRALRLYEDLGLIVPTRSGGGWRLYGASELIRLNTITLLKMAGLSLAQIKSVIDLNEHEPTLAHVLRVQIDAWQAKKEAAQRGQAIAESALKNLQSDNAVSLDELCDLVRSSEIGIQDLPATPRGDVQRVQLDARLLSEYAGSYRYSEFSIVTITVNGDSLFSEMTGKPKHELTVESDSEFYAPAIDSFIRFDRDADNSVVSMSIYQMGVKVTAPRLSEAEASELTCKLAERIKSQTPTPGSEAALRRFMHAISIGKPNFDELSPLLAEAVRRNAPLLQTMSNYWGTLRSLKFCNVSQRGLDVYEGVCDHGVVRWCIGLRADGLIEEANTLTVDPTMIAFGPDEEPSLLPRESEAALRRFMDGIRAGAPYYDEMSPLLAQTIRKQLPQLQMMGKQMGALVELKYVGSKVREHDYFDVRREHGVTRWSVIMENGKMLTATAIVTDASYAAGL